MIQNKPFQSKGRTSWEAIPHLQPVIFAVSVSPWQRIVLQVKGEEGEGDIHAGRDDDNEGALQVVGVFVGKARRLDETWGTGEIAGTVGAWHGKKKKNILKAILIMQLINS